MRIQKIQYKHSEIDDRRKQDSWDYKRTDLNQGTGVIPEITKDELLTAISDIKTINSLETIKKR